MRRVAGVLLCVAFSGCSLAVVHEADRKVNSQNKAAGAYVEEKAPEDRPDIKQAGKDVKENAIVLERTVLGTADVEEAYTPTASAKAREESVEAHQKTAGFIQGALSVATTAFPWAGTALGIGGAVLALLKKRLSDQKLLAVYSGVSRVVQDLKGVKSGEKDLDLATTAVDTLRSVAGAHNLYLEIKGDLSRLRESGLLKP